jgi:amino acid adenylation domain-containing protein
MKNLLQKLSELNVKISSVDGKLQIKAPPGVLTQELQDQIRRHRDALIVRLQNSSNGGRGKEIEQIIPDNENRYQPFPLNDVQHAYWIGRQSSFDLGNVSTHFYFEVDCADLDISRLANSFDHVISHNDMLRAVTESDGHQRILKEVPFYEFPVVDLTALSVDERASELNRIRSVQSERAIVSERWPLFEIIVVKIDEKHSRLSFSWDFIFLDAWSLLLIFDQWRKFYDDQDHKPKVLELSFRDYVLAECAIKERPSYQISKKYWWDRIDHLPPAPALPIVPRTGTGARHKFNRRTFSLSTEQWTTLKSLGGKAGLTPTSILLTAFADILDRWSSSPHYCLNLTIFNRQPLHQDVNSLVGDFTNLLVLEVDGRETEDFVEKALRLQEQFLRDFNHKDVSAVEVVRELARRNGSQQRAVLPVVFTSTLMINGSRAEDTSILERFGPVVWGISQTPQVWLDYQIFEFHGKLVLNWDTVDEAFAPGILDDMFTANSSLIESLSMSPEIWKKRHRTELPASQATLRVAYNSTHAHHSESCLHVPFLKIAVSDPDRVALISNNRQISYGELLSRSYSLAQKLLSSGVKPNHLVAIVMEKGWEQIVAVLGVHIAGGAYLPVDPNWPVFRRNNALVRMEVSIVLTQDCGLNLDIPEGLINISVSAMEKSDPVTEIPPILQTVDDLAYVIFTSGSTGEPKGVMISQNSAYNTVVHVNRLFNIGQRDRFIAVSDLGFDLSVYDIFGALSAGALIVIPDAEYSKDANHWNDLIVRHKVSVWNSAPQLMTLLSDFVEENAGQFLESLTTVMMSGDRIPVRLPDRVKAISPKAQVFSLGGATEGSIWSIYFPIGSVDLSWESIPYGKPLPNQTMYVLNKHMEACPELVKGDIYIGGVGVALGYWKDDEKTNQRFVCHPVSGERLYWTGDLGRVMGDGNIEFLGREDSQVKLRGYRVELGEIATNILAYSPVADALVQIIKHGNADVLVAYLVVRDERDVTSHHSPMFSLSTLTEMLAKRLPEYMVPQRFFVLEAFPLSVNGKVDVLALPKIDNVTASMTRSVVAPTTELQSQILAIWSEVLGVADLSITDNFFEVGGDSLSLTLVLRKLNKLKTRKVSVAELFSYSSVKALADFLENEDDTIEASPMAVSTSNNGHEIAIIGMSGRFPDANNPDELWTNLSEGKCSIRHFTNEEMLAAGVRREMLSTPNYVKAGVVLGGIDKFDADYFGVPASEAEFMDPQQRFLIEGAYEALEHAGYVSEKHAGRVGVFVGKGVPRYMIDNILNRPDQVERFGMFTILNGHDKDHASSVISHRLNLTGPSLSINSSCATSLVNLHLASQSLRNGECEIAIAGAVSFMSTLEKYGYVYEEGHITSPDGYCRSFSDDANGSVYGSGFGLVVLKPLAQALKDRDTIHAVIKGSAINNDGGSKQSYAAPGLHGQAVAIAAAQTNAGVTPEMIQYIEAHGTGTNLGDQIEFAALRKIFGGARDDGSVVALGSIKSNIGHLDAAAGMAGLIKVVLAFKYKKIPASLHAAVPNRKIDFKDSPFFVNTELRDWPANQTRRMAGVNIFGVGGTNAHVIMEEPPEVSPRGVSGASHLIVLSAQTNRALLKVAHNLELYLINNKKVLIDDVAFTLQLGRKAHDYRSYFVCSDLNDAVAKLSRISADETTLVRLNESTSIPIFMFPGSLSSSWKAGTEELFKSNSVYRDALNRCADFILASTQFDIRTVLHAVSTSAISANEDFAVPSDEHKAYCEALAFSVQYALAEYWRSLGVRPAALFGVGVGEYVAACIAEIFSLEEALSLLIVRGQIVQSLSEFKALRVNCSDDEIVSVLNGSNCSRVWNYSMNEWDVAGDRSEIELLESRFAELKISSRLVENFELVNTPLIEPMLDFYKDCLTNVNFHSPKLPLISGVTGMWLLNEEATSVAYWADNFSRPLQMEAAIDHLKRFNNGIVLEVGTCDVLTRIVRSFGFSPQKSVAAFGERGCSGNELSALQESIGCLWKHGIDIDWEKIHEGNQSGRIPLPTYPLERKRYWIDRPTVLSNSGQVQAEEYGYGKVDGDFAEREKTLVEARDYDESRAAYRPRPELSSEYIAPKNEIETRLSEIWGEYLGIRNIGSNDNFFDLGGDSLMATRVYSRIKKEFDVELPMDKIFSLGTVKRLYLFIATTTNINAVNDLSDEDLVELEAIIAE